MKLTEKLKQQELDAVKDLTQPPSALLSNLGREAVLTKLDPLRHSLFTLLALAHNELPDSFLLPDSILWKFSALTSLDLSGNRLSHLPDEISGLKQLAQLDLSANRMTQFPSAVLDLTSLESLNLKSNNIALIPITFTQLTALQTFSIDRVRNVPEEILAQGVRALREYFFDILAEGSVRSFRMKLMFVGKAAAGKVHLFIPSF